MRRPFLLVLVAVLLATTVVSLSMFLRTYWSHSQACSHGPILHASQRGEILLGDELVDDVRLSELLEATSSQRRPCVTLVMSEQSLIGSFSRLKEAAETHGVRVSVTFEDGVTRLMSDDTDRNR